MRTVMHRVMNFAYLDNGVPRVVTARVLIEYPAALQESARHVLGNIALNRKNVFVIDDEDVEFQSDTLMTDHVSWRFDSRDVTSIPRAASDPQNRSCICCAMGEYFTRCLKIWLRNKASEIQDITVDLVIADHEDAHYIEDIKPDIGAQFFETSVFVINSVSRTWTNIGVMLTDNSRYSGHTIFVAEKGDAVIASTSASVDIVEYNSDVKAGEPGSLLSVLSQFTDRFGVFNGTLMIKD